MKIYSVGLFVSYDYDEQLYKPCVDDLIGINLCKRQSLVIQHNSLSHC